ncbi:MAG: hypothetical protein LUI39_11505 [Lachnospiraceae bacterium]|nr:hypothetical protein [Lachnospiraceae bacterium]
MVRYVIYADREQTIAGLENYLREATLERDEWPLVHAYIGTDALPEYLKFVHQNPCLIMLVVAAGSCGREAAKQIRDNNRDARMLWFSDRENGVCSYEIGVTWFGLLPVTRESVAGALDACQIQPPASKCSYSTYYNTVSE